MFELELTSVSHRSILSPSSGGVSSIFIIQPVILEMYSVLTVLISVILRHPSILPSSTDHVSSIFGNSHGRY